MGENWPKKTDSAYISALKRHLDGLVPPPLLVEEEEEETSYHCQLMSPENPVFEGEDVNVFARTERSRIAVVRVKDIMGYLDGDSGKDLRKLLMDSKLIDCPVSAKVVSAPTGAMFFEIVLVVKKTRKAK